MRSLLRYLYRYILPERIRPYIDVFPSLRGPTRIEKILNEKNILILSPHPDDDIIACGGTIHRSIESGAHVTTVYLTDGRKGNPRYPEDELIRLRQEEARTACGIIGVQRMIFMGNVDGELSVSEENVERLYNIFREYAPEAVILPFFLDNHHDHLATNHLILHLLKTHRFSFMCYAYGIWTPLIPNMLLDITDIVDIKRRALSAFKTQLEVFDLIELSLSISRYCAFIHGNGKGYYEGFVACSAAEYRRLMEISR
jgi:LmbE family N-acetylglucosaminyl deacetylase